MSKRKEHYKDYYKNYRKEHKEGIKEYHSSYYINNKERINKNSSKWARDNPDKIRASKLRCQYGLTVEEYQQMLESQGFVCSICESPETVTDIKGNLKSLCVDHNHSTGKVRGLLCDSCNRGLGFLKDSRQVLSNALIYLEENDG